MKAISGAIFSLMITGTQALASARGANAEGMGLLAALFIAFAVLVILFQFIPGILLFVGILKAVFSSKVRKPCEDAVENDKTGL